jgi:hypothetical protein
MEQIGRRALARDQRGVLLQSLGVEEVHVVLQVRRRRGCSWCCCCSSRAVSTASTTIIVVGQGPQLVVEPPVEVVGLPPLAARDERVLAQVLVHRGGAAFLSERNIHTHKHTNTKKSQRFAVSSLRNNINKW